MCYRLSHPRSLLGAFVYFTIRFDLHRRETAFLDRAPQQREIGFAARLERHAGNAGLEFEAHRLNMFDTLDRALDVVASERSVGAADENPRIHRCRINHRARRRSVVGRLASRLKGQSRGRQTRCQ